MATWTLEELRDAFRDLGDYPASHRKITDPRVNGWLNRAIGNYCDLLDETHEGHRDTVDTLATTNGTATVTLFADFLKAKAVDIQIDGEWVPLRRLSIRQTYGYDSENGEPVGYLQRGNVLELFPTPDAVYAIRLRYVPAVPTLVDDADSIDVPNGWEEFILETALLSADKMMDKPLNDRKDSIERARQRVARAAEGRNQAEPEYLVPHGDLGDYL